MILQGTAALPVLCPENVPPGAVAEPAEQIVLDNTTLCATLLVAMVLGVPGFIQLFNKMGHNFICDSKDR